MTDGRTDGHLAAKHTGKDLIYQRGRSKKNLAVGGSIEEKKRIAVILNVLLTYTTEKREFSFLFLPILLLSVSFHILIPGIPSPFPIRERRFHITHAW